MFAPRFRDNPLVLLVVRVTLEKTSVLASSFDLFVFDLKPFDLSFQEFLGQLMLSSFRSLLDFGGSAIYPLKSRRRSGSSHLESSRASPIIGEICVPLILYIDTGKNLPECKDLFSERNVADKQIRQ